jgi:twitching motility protein PilU
MSAMKRLFQVMAEKKASDIFLSVGSPINIKINGVAVPVNQTVLNADASAPCSTKSSPKGRSRNTRTRWS